MFNLDDYRFEIIQHHIIPELDPINMLNLLSINKYFYSLDTN